MDTNTVAPLSSRLSTADDFMKNPSPDHERHYNIGLVGLGRRGYKTHFLTVEGSRSESITAVCDPNEKTLAAFQAKHPDVPAYRRLEDLLSHHKPDFCVVSVPHKYHVACASILAEAGVPILKEKPIADSADEFLRLSSLPVKIGVTFQKRFEPCFVQFKKLLPLIGNVASFRATLTKSIQDLESTWRADGVGVTEDLGCHMLDVIVWLFGSPSSLMANSAKSVRRYQKYSGEDISNIIMRFHPSNVIGHAHLSRVATEDEESISVTGTNGTLQLAHKNIILQDSAGTHTLEIVDRATKKSIIRSMLRQFGDFVTGHAADYSGSLSNLADTMAIMDATKRSFRSTKAENLYPLTETAQARLDGAHHVWPLITSDTVDATVEQLNSSLSIYNRSNIYETFEERWRKMHGLKHALVCSSGTIAIFHMFEALDLRPGDEVLCPVYTFFATATPMLQYGAVPIFCDALSDGNINPAEVLVKSTPKTKAVIVTHMWGLPCDMKKIVTNAASVNGGIKVLEDCSHAHGAIVDGKIVGAWGHMAAWSLQAKKNITGGQAGVLATNSTDYYARAITHGHFNKRAKQEVPKDHPLRKFWLTGLGLNLRAHPLAISIANQQLNLMSTHMSYRSRYANYMIRRLSAIPFLRMPSIKNQKTDRHSWYAFVMQFEQSQAPEGITREKFVQALHERGLKEVDIPRSTGLLNKLPLFTDTHEAIPRYGERPWHAEQPDSLFPIALEFYDKAVKLPVWATPSDAVIVEHYADTFIAVAEELVGCSLGKKGNKNKYGAAWADESQAPQARAKL